MPVRRVLASLAMVSAFAALVIPTPGYAATAGKPGVIKPQKTHFDLQAHRGGLGLTTEESLEGFGKALRLGVSTLELDTHVTKDGKVVVNHDRQISAVKCRDTAPVTPGDPMYPYVGKFIKDLTLAQIKTMDCGYQQLPGFPQQEVVKGFRMVELKDVLNLVKSHHAKNVKLNIETKVEAGAPDETAPRELFVRRVFEEIHKSGIEKQVTIQSFDWGALMAMHRLAPKWPLVALTNYDFVQKPTPGPSPWLGGIDPADFGGDMVKAAASIKGVTALSPVYGSPADGTVSDPNFRFWLDDALVSHAHALGLKVIPWTADDPSTIEAMMNMGIDGIITDYPDRVRQIMADRGMRLPKAYKRH
jgi:glycerophosphoryl diester phosphodiesterase